MSIPTKVHSVQGYIVISKSQRADCHRGHRLINGPVCRPSSINLHLQSVTAAPTSHSHLTPVESSSTISSVVMPGTELCTIHKNNHHSHQTKTVALIFVFQDFNTCKSHSFVSSFFHHHKILSSKSQIVRRILHLKQDKNKDQQWLFVLFQAIVKYRERFPLCSW